VYIQYLVKKSYMQFFGTALVSMYPDPEFKVNASPYSDPDPGARF
jgi:hypothetical protein